MQYRPPESQEFEFQLPREAMPQDFLLHERIMGQCIHRDHRVEFERDGYGETCLGVCTTCGAHAVIDFKARGSRNFRRPWPPEERPADFIKFLVPHYTDDVVIARTISRHLEIKGWRGMLRDERSKFRYTIRKGEAKFASSDEPSEAAAICGAAVALARSGQPV